MTTIATTKDLENAVLRHQKLYDAGNPTISDAKFDQIVAQLRQKSPSSKVLDQLGKPTTNKKIQHREPMQSLRKFYTIQDVVQWSSKTGETLFAIQPKYDGVALSLWYRRGKLRYAATRGDGARGDLVTERALLCPSIPKKIKTQASTEVRGELIMPATVFEDMFEGEFANARNAVAGNLMRKRGRTDVLKACDFFGHEFIADNMDFDLRMKAIGDLGFMPTHTALVANPAAMGEKLDAFSTSFRTFDYEMDGLVIKVCSDKIQREMGATSHHPRWACALKFRGETARTTILGVTWQVSRAGTLTPVAELTPVELDGVTISRATLHHHGRFAVYEPCVGDTVRLARRGGVIPHIEAVSHEGGEKLHAPKVCPSCDGSLNLEGDFLKCQEPECESALVQKLRHWAKVVGMDCWGPEVIQKLYDVGSITYPNDFYSLATEEITALDGFSHSSSFTLMCEVGKASTLPMDKFIAALGIPQIGTTIAKRIAKAIPDIDSLGFVKLDIPGVGKSRVDALQDWIIDNSDLLEDLLEVVEVTPVMEPNMKGPLAGKSIVFTGRLSDMERTEAQHLTHKYGGDASGSLTKQTDYLVVGDLAKGNQLTKRNKAEKDGVAIICETEFVSMLAEAMTVNDQ